MPRPRTLDPLGIPQTPNLATDPERLAYLVAQFHKRLSQLVQNYLMAKRVARDDHLYFNTSVDKLRESVARVERGERLAVPLEDQLRLHPELMIMINFAARSLAGLRDGDEFEKKYRRFLEPAAAKIDGIVKKRLGRPKSDYSQDYLEALMALLIRVTGTPIVGPRTKNSVYEPHLDDPMGMMVRQFFDLVDPAITTTSLVTMIGKARKKYAGKSMRFEDFLPFFGGSLDPKTGAPQLGAGYQLQSFTRMVPIYCP